MNAHRNVLIFTKLPPDKQLIGRYSKRPFNQQTADQTSLLAIRIVTTDRGLSGNYDTVCTVWQFDSLALPNCRTDQIKLYNCDVSVSVCPKLA